MPTFKPDGEKLNANFDGYKLGKESLACVSRSFKGEVRVARLKEEDFSYQHVRAFSLCNHLTVDSWDEQSVYWCTNGGAILRGRHTSSGVKVSTVFQCSATLGSAVCNPSLSFVSPHHCIFTSGCDSSLCLLYTQARTSPTQGEVEENGTLWRLLEEVKLPGIEGEAVQILSADYSKADCRLNLATMMLCGAATGLGKGKSPIAMYNWHCLDVDLVSSPVVDSSSSSTKGPVVCEIESICSLHSCTIALFAAFAAGRLVILSEADLVLSTERDENTNTADIGRREPQKTEKEEGDTGRVFTGLGFERGGEQSSAKPEYQWSQTESEITITVALPSDATKHDVHCVIERREVVVGLTDGTTYFRGRLFAPINVDCSTWTLENHSLEVTLEKQREGVEWTSLKEEEGASEDGTSSRLPLRGPVTDALSSEELKKKVTEITGSNKEENLPVTEKDHPLVQSTHYEECDFTDEDATFYIFTNNTSIPDKVPLAGRQFLFSSPSLRHTPPLCCLKHDVDAILWQLETPPNSDSAHIIWKHVGTFNALAYVQAARQDKKFTVCPPSMEFAALCDCSRHVFMYLQPEEGVQGNTATQYVTTLGSTEDILGLQATNAGLVFVLKESELHVITVS